MTQEQLTRALEIRKEVTRIYELKNKLENNLKDGIYRIQVETNNRASGVIHPLRESNDPLDIIEKILCETFVRTLISEYERAIRNLEKEYEAL